jgi:hypothetical protein
MMQLKPEAMQTFISAGGAVAPLFPIKYFSKQLPMSIMSPSIKTT